ncbi:hypothetical protein EVAR_92801_1 [Eumeta japonica]|uniref:Uncharacterized protein n=1 Tax=Eumeta variegata TaxID=151549 RepID=A0A4C2A0S3_EUMVA|nr:hypothetical protein EVAR_92801_1 [Eumeta japonica]
MLLQLSPECAEERRDWSEDCFSSLSERRSDVTTEHKVYMTGIRFRLFRRCDRSPSVHVVFRASGVCGCHAVCAAAVKTGIRPGEKLRLPCRLHAEPAHGFCAWGALP